MIKRCVECHQPSNQSADLSLVSHEHFSRGGESGSLVDAADPAESLLLLRIDEGEMPPPEKGKSRRLPDRERDILRRWIVSGASWPKDRTLDWFERTTDARAGRDWWSLQPIVRPELPPLQGAVDGGNPIDRLVLAKMARDDVAPAPVADKRILIRRLYYDLIGLPPTYDQIQNFVHDQSATAWEHQIDQLLQSPQYGERWARYWLDLARYADTSGYERDQEKPFAWKYRDWVVDALNQDLPFADFVTQQLAGDEIDQPTEQSIIATGFLRLGSWNDEPNDPADYTYERLEDLVHTTASAFFGLTVKCARCHAHKFDPITQEDYYRMASAFWAGPVTARDSKLLGGPSDAELGVTEVLAWTDLSAQPTPIRLLKNGERESPMHEVVPASLSSLPALEQVFDPPPAGSRTTKRRLQLAQWIVDRNNPLPARVMVNRLWQHHFGAAIVRTPNNFGFLADPPTHPKLLDWLAAEYLANGGKTKPLHKLILMSQTWRQSALHPDHERLQQIDPTNRLWWRASRRRLDAESLRDSILAATGDLDRTLGGEPFRPTIAPEALEGLSKKSAAYLASPPNRQRRRSLYMYLKRGLLPPLMSTFDLCDPTGSCGQRSSTTVPTQALALLNNQFVHTQSERVASSIADRSTSEVQQIRQVWQQILRRLPTERELGLAREHLRAQRESFLASAQVPPPQSDQQLAESLVVHLRADQAVTELENSRVVSIPNLVGRSNQPARLHEANQPHEAWRPSLQDDGIGGQPALRFNGQDQFLALEGQPLPGPTCTIIAVVRDAKTDGHRAIVSNWSRGSNVGTSLFLGLTGKSTVRFSDGFAAAGEVDRPQVPFVLTAVSGRDAAAVFQNGRRLRVKTGPLTNRRFHSPWTIGQQGDIQGEYWQGEVAEIRIYDRSLSEPERQSVEAKLGIRYDIEMVDDEASDSESRTPEILALASLCHVLMNSNEFIYID